MILELALTAVAAGAIGYLLGAPPKTSEWERYTCGGCGHHFSMLDEQGRCHEPVRLRILAGDPRFDDLVGCLTKEVQCGCQRYLGPEPPELVVQAWTGMFPRPTASQKTLPPT